jgi:cell division septation protein DedD
MTDFTILVICTLALTAILPLSVFCLYVVLAQHVQLAPSSPMDSAAVERFDSESERAAWHADRAAAVAARTAAVLACYERIRQAELGPLDPLDPRRAALAGAQPPRATEAGSADGAAEQPAAEHAAAEAEQAAAEGAAAPAMSPPPRAWLRRGRLAIRRRRAQPPAHRGNGSST